MDIGKQIWPHLLVVTILFSSAPAAGDVILTPTDVTRMYGYASSLQGSDEYLYGEGVIGENEWNISTDPLENPDALAEDDPIDPAEDPLNLNGLSSFATSRSGLTDPNGWSDPNNKDDTFQLFINNQATQDPGGSGGSYGPYGWGYSVAYLIVTYDTAPSNGSNLGDPMTITLDLSFAQDLYADGFYDEYFLDVGYALGTGLVDYDPVLADPASQNNPGIGQFDQYTYWGSSGYSYQELTFNDSLQYSGVIGDQVQVLIALSSYSFSFHGYAWTEATLDPTQNLAQAGMGSTIAKSDLMQDAALEETDYTSMKVKVTATTDTAPARDVIFGPVQYIRTEGEPNRYRDTFFGTEGKGWLIIENGEENGENRLNSALIMVNEQEIVDPKYFNQNVYKQQIPVNFNENNSIRMELRGNPESYLTIIAVQ